MLRNLLLNSCLKFCRINPSNYQEATKLYLSHFRISQMGKYLQQYNVIPFISMITEIKTPLDKALESIDVLEQLCGNATDEQISVLAVLKQTKGTYYYENMMIPEAIHEYQEAIKIHQMVGTISQIELARLYLQQAVCYIQVNNLAKGQHILNQAISIFSIKKIESDQRVTQLSAISYAYRAVANFGSSIAESRLDLKKSIQYWQKMPVRLTKEYEMTIHLKCNQHKLFKEIEHLKQTASSMLQLIQITKKQMAANRVQSQGIYFYEVFYLASLNFCDPSQTEHLQAIKNLIAEFRAKYGQRVQQLVLYTQQNVTDYKEELSTPAK